MKVYVLMNNADHETVILAIFKYRKDAEQEKKLFLVNRKEEGRECKSLYFPILPIEVIE